MGIQSRARRRYFLKKLLRKDSRKKEGQQSALLLQLMRKTILIQVPILKLKQKKYFQNLKNRLQTVAIWFVENKDKTLDEILVDRWKEKCSGTDSKKEKRKRCVAAALAEREEDTSVEKLVKDALKSLLEEDSDEVYDFLSTFSSRTFREIENEGHTQELGTEAADDCQTQVRSGR